MQPTFITYAAKKTAAIVIAGTVVVATGSFALAAVGDDDPMIEDDQNTEPVITEGDEGCDEDVAECPADDATEDEDDGTGGDDESDATGGEGTGGDDGSDATEGDDTGENDDTEGDDGTGGDATEEGPEPETAEEADVPSEDLVEPEYRNHGEAVRKAARETCPKGPGHGACVAEVATSDAGKAPKAPAGDDGTSEEADVTENETGTATVEAGTEVEAGSEVETEAGTPGKGNNGKAHGKSSGKKR